MKKMVFVVLSVLVSGSAFADLSNTTDYSVCSRPGNYTLDGNWKVDMAQGGFKMTAYFQFNQDTLNLTNVCTLNGQTAQAKVSTPIMVMGNHIETMGSGQDNENSNGTNCNVSVHPDSMDYSFQGSCLVLSQPGNPQQMILVPAN
jgi:hypothetical protein